MERRNTMDARIAPQPLRTGHVLAAVAALALLAGCDNAGSDAGDDAARIGEEARELVAALQDFGSNRQDEAAEYLRNALDDVDQRISQLEEEVNQRMADSSEAARRETQAALERLRERREDMAEWLADLEEASADTWEDTRDQAAQAYRRLADALEAARAEL